MWLEVFASFGAVILVVGGTTFALKLEENDSFCASCHTQPEVKYYQQSLAGNPETLAASHHIVKETVRCIDCHSGAGTFRRADGLKQGAHDLFTYLSGRYHSPAVTTNPIPDAWCMKCHADVLPSEVVRKVGSTKDHYHLYLPYWHQLDAEAARCAECHTAHTSGSPSDGFLNNGAAGIVCEDCHRALSGKTVQ